MPIYKIAIEGNNLSHTLAMLLMPPKMTKPVSMAKPKPTQKPYGAMDGNMTDN